MVLGLVLTLAASGCKKKPTPLTQLPGSKAGAPSTPGHGGPTDTGNGNPLGGDTGGPKVANTDGTTAIPPNGPESHQGWIENADALKVDTVYFAFDSAVVKDSEKSKVTAVADYLKANPTAAVRVEGNCDERGTEEYNRSLGDRRALAVREMLVGMGIAATTVDTITYGKDRPADPGHDEAAWKKNRRDDFVVLTPPAKP